MKPRGRKLGKTVGGEQEQKPALDKKARTEFSQLPEEAIGAIVNRLSDAKDVAVCATVCRLWRKLASQVETLDFMPLASTLNEGIRYEEAVTTMVLRSAGLKRLRVNHELWGGSAREALLLSWLLHAGRHLEELYLEDSDDLASFRNTRQLWNISQYCPKLQKLTFAGEFILGSEPSICTMACLRSLVLEKVSMSHDNLVEVMAGCPSLEEITLNWISHLSEARLRGKRSLRHVTFHMGDMEEIAIGAPRVTEIVVDAPLLTRLDLHMCPGRLEVLHVTSEALQTVDPCVYALRNLKELKLDCPLAWQIFVRLAQSCVTKFRQAFPSLQYLHLGGSAPAGAGEEEEQRLPAILSACPALRTLFVSSEGAAVQLAAEPWRLLGPDDSVPHGALQEVHIAAGKLSSGLASLLSRLCSLTPTLRTLNIYTGETGEYHCHFFAMWSQLQKGYSNVSFELVAGSL